MSRKNYIIANDKKLSTRYIGILLILVIFIFFFFPFFGSTLRYQLGSVIQKLFNTIGIICLTGGTFLIILSFIGLIVGRSIKVGWFVVAIVLIWVGCWCTDAIVNLFGITIGDSTSSGGSGYH